MEPEDSVAFVMKAITAYTPAIFVKDPSVTVWDCQHWNYSENMNLVSLVTRLLEFDRDKLNFVDPICSTTNMQKLKNL